MSTLRRTLGLWDLVFCGIILIQPTAPMPNFGILGQDAKGHIVTVILIAMVAMLFTAVSYGRMARHRLSIRARPQVLLAETQGRSFPNFSFFGVIFRKYVQ
jgi:hypothetical protein